MIGTSNFTVGLSRLCQGQRCDRYRPVHGGRGLAEQRPRFDLHYRHSDKMPMPITAKALPHRRLGMRLLVKGGSDGHPGSRPGAKTVADVAAAPGRNQVPRGIAYMLGSTVMFAGGNAVVKWQLATYPLGEVAFGRTLFAFLTVAAIILPRAGWSVLRTRRYREHLQRRLSQFSSMLCWFLASSA